MARHRFSNPPFDQINVTPLIDTLFFLLIIFMITAPLLEYSMDVTPPSYNAASIKPDDNSKVVNIRKNGDIVLEGKVVTLEELVQRLIALRDSGRKYSFFLRADADLRYGTVIDVLRSVKNAGFNDLSLITSAEE
ncbi:MAG: biopolymer transporter ExbD [Victivallales bacterium]|jgi:biopolymer transport protein exbD/tolR